MYTNAKVEMHLQDILFVKLSLAIPALESLCIQSQWRKQMNRERIANESWRRNKEAVASATLRRDILQITLDFCDMI